MAALAVTGVSVLPLDDATLGLMKVSPEPSAVEAHDGGALVAGGVPVSGEGRAACRAEAQRAYREGYVGRVHDYGTEDMPRHMPVGALLGALEEQMLEHAPAMPGGFAERVLLAFPALLPEDSRNVVQAADELEANKRTARVVVDELVERLLDAMPDDPLAFLRECAAELRAAEQARLMAKEQDVVDAPLWMLSPAEVRDAITKVFMKFDVDKNGVLDRKELKAALKSSELNLSQHAVNDILAEADENDDGLISYEEFLPLMVELISATQAKEAAREARAAATAARREQAVFELVKGLEKGELEAKMRRVFQHFDRDGNGTLDRNEFKRCLGAAQLGFTKKEINLLLSAIDVNEDGTVDYNEFIPLCFLVLVERKVAKMEEEEALDSEDMMQQIMLDYFTMYDAEGNGKIARRNLNQGLRQFSDDFGLSLSLAQIAAVAGEAEAKPDGLIDYAPFVPVAAHIIYEMEGITAAKQIELGAATMMAESAGAKAIHGLPYDEVVDIIRRAFVIVDVDNNGVLTMDEMEQMLRLMETADGTPFALSDLEIDAIICACDVNGDGFVEYFELENFIFDVLHQIETKKNLERRTMFNTAAEIEVAPEVVEEHPHVPGAET